MTRLIDLRLRTFLAALAFLSGCVSIEKDYPDKRYFVLEVSRDTPPQNSSGKGVLQVLTARVSPRYADRNFVYRRSDTRFESDFYNQFLVSPAALITEEVRRELSRAGTFNFVVASANPLPPTHTMETMVNRLYGDFRDLAAPKAVVEMEFFLTQETSPNAGIVFHKVYERIVPVQERTPETLVRGLNQALEGILESLVTDLKSANLEAQNQ
jgi:cholesterol transport system auxiliary component